jgi:amino acid adenylation domain-containing protein
LFTNVLPLRLNLGGDPSARELFQQARSVMLEALTWQALPFAALVNALAPQRDLSRTPIYNVAINMMNVPRRSTSIPGLELGEVHRDEMPAQFDMTFEFADEGDHFSGSVIFNIDLYDKSTIARMASHFENILEGMLAGADHPVSSVEMLSESERHQMLVEWNVTETDYPSRYCLHEWIEQQVAKTPDAPAVSFDGRTLSYRELNQRANQLAHTLRGLGVGAETLVALYLERSLEMIVGLLGILKAGGAYVPIDPVYPMERRAFILKDSATPVVLTLRRMTENLPKCEARVVCIDLDDEIFTIAPDENLPNVANPENLAYIIYTSGSTGTPKGVMVTHHNVVRLFQATQPWYHFDSNDVWTMFHSYAFDFSVWEIWGALIYGGRVVVVSYLVSRSPETFYQLVKEEGVTVLNQTPSAFYQFIQADAADGKGTQLKLRFVIFGGDALDLQALRPWFERHGDLEPQLVNMYGITETTVHVTYRPIHMRDLDEKMGSMIGQPIPDLQVYLLDNHQNLCPTGVTGEIYVGGAGVARGYLRRDSLTVEKFIADPFRPAENHRLYKSGDLARRLPNGDLEYLGRSDFQIKIRGFRVELGEIESLLMKYPGIQQAMVMLREDQPGDKRLAGYIIPSAGTVLEASPLREYLKSKLPVYMVPSAFICMDAFPLTPNGKVDRKRLPAPELGDVLHHDYIPPRTPTEQSLSKIWMEVLGLSRVGIADDFFEIGGDSLSAVQVMSRLQRELEIKLPIYKIFEFSRLADLAAQLELALRQQEQNAGDRETFGL